MKGQTGCCTWTLVEPSSISNLLINNIVIYVIIIVFVMAVVSLWKMCLMMVILSSYRHSGSEIYIFGYPTRFLLLVGGRFILKVHLTAVCHVQCFFYFQTSMAFLMCISCVCLCSAVTSCFSLLLSSLPVSSITLFSSSFCQVIFIFFF